MYLFLHCVLCFFINIVTRYMYDAARRDFALSATFVLECFDGSEMTTREGIFSEDRHRKANDNLFRY